MKNLVPAGLRSKKERLKKRLIYCYFPFREAFNIFVKEKNGNNKQSHIVSFCKKHTDAVAPVDKWIELVENNEFTGHNKLKAFFQYADYVGNSRYVFNIKGNRYRFVVLVVFVLGIMEIRFCGTHAEYAKIKNIENL